MTVKTLRTKQIPNCYENPHEIHKELIIYHQSGKNEVGLICHKYLL